MVALAVLDYLLAFALGTIMIIVYVAAIIIVCRLLKTEKKKRDQYLSITFAGPLTFAASAHFGYPVLASVSSVLGIVLSIIAIVLARKRHRELSG